MIYSVHENSRDGAIVGFITLCEKVPINSILVHKKLAKISSFPVTHCVVHSHKHLSGAPTEYRFSKTGKKYDYHIIPIASTGLKIKKYPYISTNSSASTYSIGYGTTITLNQIYWNSYIR